MIHIVVEWNGPTVFGCLLWDVTCTSNKNTSRYEISGILLLQVRQEELLLLFLVPQILVDLHLGGITGRHINRSK